MDPEIVPALRAVTDTLLEVLENWESFTPEEQENLKPSIQRAFKSFEVLGKSITGNWQRIN